MQWMLPKGYSKDMLQKINQLKRSQVMQLELNGISHQILPADLISQALAQTDTITFRRLNYRSKVWFDC